MPELHNLTRKLDALSSRIEEVRDQCLTQGVAFFFKQWGGFRPKRGGRNLDPREWNEMPVRVTA